MSLLDAVAILITLSALLSYLNHRVLRLPTTIGLLLSALCLSLLVLVVGTVAPSAEEAAQGFLARVDFDDALLHGMLGFLLFAGALHVDLSDLARQGWTVAALATVGVLLSTALVGVMTWGLSGLLGLGLEPVHCFLFGALISPTDPIAVLGLLRQVGAPTDLAITITGESLFNDGVGVVVFLALLGAAGTSGHQSVTAGGVLGLFVVEALGGALFGLAVGLVAYWMLRSVDRYQVEVLLSLALVAGGWALAEALHLSAPIAMVVAGLLIGNHGRAFAMSTTTREHLDTFWELVDEVLNAVLFVLIGLEVLVLRFSTPALVAGLAAIPLVLLARLASVGLPVAVLRRFRQVPGHAVKVMTWGGLRGGISVALALALGQQLAVAHPESRDTILVLTYVVVVFSIAAQGLSLKGALRRWGVSGGETATG